MYTVYAISSLSRNYIYVGFSSQLPERLKRHNEGKNKTTKPYAPFELIYTKGFDTRVEARKYEKYLKSGSGKEFLKRLVKKKE
ncbi:MAG: GIY-YIG nuclease family protein [Balneolaceae bacterium]|nr:GIY-YIG nuclease family protein [Balneolaceae bacterium]